MAASGNLTAAATTFLTAAATLAALATLVAVGRYTGESAASFDAEGGLVADGGRYLPSAAQLDAEGNLTADALRELSAVVLMAAVGSLIARPQMLGTVNITGVASFHALVALFTGELTSLTPIAGLIFYAANPARSGVLTSGTPRHSSCGSATPVSGAGVSTAPFREDEVLAATPTRR
jgi:hypothetical protein